MTTKATITAPPGAVRAVAEVKAGSATEPGRVMLTFYDKEGKEVQHVDVSGEDGETA